MFEDCYGRREADETGKLGGRDEWIDFERRITFLRQKQRSPSANQGSQKTKKYCKKFVTSTSRKYVHSALPRPHNFLPHHQLVVHVYVGTHLVDVHVIRLSWLHPVPSPTVVNLVECAQPQPSRLTMRLGVSKTNGLTAIWPCPNPVSVTAHHAQF